MRRLLMMSLLVLVLIGSGLGAAPKMAPDTKPPEMKGREVLETKVTPCGESWFGMEVYPDGHWELVEWKGVRIVIRAYGVSEADRLNGLSWHGRALFLASARRSYRTWEGQSWTPWVDRGDAPQVFREEPRHEINMLMERRGDRWIITPSAIYALTFRMLPGSRSYGNNADERWNRLVKPTCEKITPYLKK